eukprot:CAMPEP_0174307234 /NCGR_PEP_ID=MMETSP0810-20121108/985_1 /TAXON_ID=73025 ORGANISM="Eutreptiella gymnastica-like, Strain CCMP1594" /NCGR_SAMPLE_ID=MMETSP0810 /ASSEMBLY_ACC=CAM_ASM_000659 /LENGTH=2121 /DNA_ID=CAMNT_0015414221 /DNA_START=114 /DNA_END=6476 /DNA_ORIENTATION=-
MVLLQKKEELRKLQEAIDDGQKELDHLRHGAKREDFKGKIAVGPVNNEIWQQRWESVPKWRQRHEEDQILAREQDIKRRIRELQRVGKWTDRGLLGPSCDPRRNKTHWDYLLEEMEDRYRALMDDRTRRQTTAGTCGKRVQQWHKARQAAESKKVKDEEEQVRKIAKTMAKGVKKFWEEIDKLIEDKHKMISDEKNNRLLMRKQQKIIANAEELTTELRADFGADDEEHSEASSSSSVSADSNEEDNEDTLEQEEMLAAEAGETDENELKDLEEMAEMDLEELQAKIAAAMEADDNEENGDMEVDEEEEEEEENEKGKETEPGAQHTAKAMDEKMMDDILADLKKSQPDGVDLSTATVKVKLPFLMNPQYQLREYQLIGMDWLNTMYTKDLNGILADEMGLGKTVMTIAMLANLACTKEIWGPHLIVVPTSVLLNWEIEFKRFCPSFKVLTYYGSRQYRLSLRKGWNTENRFHVCITSYNLILSDATVFRRKKWHYMILDEAQYIKNWKSKKWETLLNFNTERRLLLTGTPLQNNLMELWSLLHFLMPDAVAFESNQEFREWFSNPMNEMVTGQSEINAPLIRRLHSLLRPFILRRLKKDVEKQMPKKYHHVLSCKLSKRQRILYDDFMNLATTKDAIYQGSYTGLIGVLMSLRKVCNHPDLFEERPIISPFDQLDPIDLRIPRQACQPMEHLEDRMRMLRWLHVELADSWSAAAIQEKMVPPKVIIEEMKPLHHEDVAKLYPHHAFGDYSSKLAAKRVDLQQERASLIARTNILRCNVHTLGVTANKVRILKELADLWSSPRLSLYCADEQFEPCGSRIMQSLVMTPEARMVHNNEHLKKFTCYIAAARSRPPTLSAFLPIHYRPQKFRALQMEDIPQFNFHALAPYRETFVRTQLYFPDKYLMQYDCGKLQVLARLLAKLKSEGSRVLIFTQMSKMLNVLESFLCMHGHTYLRLDGATKLEDRQFLMERFNNDVRIFCFILSTRSGGLGINLTGANCVVFYDSDWNPAMDLQAQDRCHRIGQTRDVHIYRLISEHTIEANIYKKVQEKKMIVNVTLKGGQFGADFYSNKVDIKDFFHSYDEDMDQNEIKRLQAMAGEETGEEEKEKEEVKVKRTISKEQKSDQKPNQKEDSKVASGVQIEGAAEIVTEELAPLPDYGAMEIDKTMESALVKAEDEDDRIAYRKAKEEISKELKEFDENYTFKDIDLVDVDVMEEEFSAKLRPLVRRSMEFYIEANPERVEEIAGEYKVEEYDDLINEPAAPVPVVQTTSASASSSSSTSCAPAVVAGCNSSTSTSSATFLSNSSSSGACAAGAPASSSALLATALPPGAGPPASSAPAPVVACTSSSSSSSSSTSYLATSSSSSSCSSSSSSCSPPSPCFTSGISVGAHTAISSNESRKRPGDEPLGPSSKRQRSSLHPNGRGEEPEGGASSPVEDLPPIQFKRVVTHSYTSGIHVLARLPVPHPLLRAPCRRLAPEPKPPDPSSSCDDAEEVPLYYETEHADDVLAQYRGIQFDLTDSDIEAFYNHCKVRVDREQQQEKERQRQRQEQDTGFPDTDSQSVSDEESDESERRRRKKFRVAKKHPEDDFERPIDAARRDGSRAVGRRPGRSTRYIDQEMDDDEDKDPAPADHDDYAPRRGRPVRGPRRPVDASPPTRRKDGEENSEMRWQEWEEASLWKAVEQFGLKIASPTPVANSSLTSMGSPSCAPVAASQWNWDLFCDILNTSHYPSATPRGAFYCKAQYNQLQQQQQQPSRQRPRFTDMNISAIQKETKRRHLQYFHSLLQNINQQAGGQKLQKATKRRKTSDAYQKTSDAYQATDANLDVHVWPIPPLSPVPMVRMELKGPTPKELVRKIGEKQRALEQHQRQASINQGQFQHPNVPYTQPNNYSHPGVAVGGAHAQPGTAAATCPAVPNAGPGVRPGQVSGTAHAPAPSVSGVAAGGGVGADPLVAPSAAQGHMPDPAAKNAAQAWEISQGGHMVAPFRNQFQQRMVDPQTAAALSNATHLPQTGAVSDAAAVAARQYNAQSGAVPAGAASCRQPRPPTAAVGVDARRSDPATAVQPQAAAGHGPHQPQVPALPSAAGHHTIPMYSHLQTDQLQQQARLQHTPQQQQQQQQQQ